MGYSPKAARARRDHRSLHRDPNIANFVLHSASPRADWAGGWPEQGLQLLEEILLQTSYRCSNARLAMQTRVVVDGSIDGAAMHSPQSSRLVGAGPSPRGALR